MKRPTIKSLQAEIAVQQKKIDELRQEIRSLQFVIENKPPYHEHEASDSFGPYLPRGGVQPQVVGLQPWNL